MHPELIQEDVTANNLYSSYLAYDKNRFIQKSKELREYLKQGSAKEVASFLNAQ